MLIESLLVGACALLAYMLHDGWQHFRAQRDRAIGVPVRPFFTIFTIQSLVLRAALCALLYSAWHFFR